MSWQYSGIKGTVPSWICDSCTAMKGKCCPKTIQVLNTFDLHSKSSSVARSKGSEHKLADVLQPGLEAIEKDCLHSTHNAAERPADTRGRLFEFDYSRGVKIYLDTGEAEVLTQDEILDAQRNENAERIRTFSPHIGQ